MATVMGLTIETIYGLWVLSSDLVFVLLFPQLLCAVYLKFVNVYGSIAAFIVGSVLRICGGEKIIGLPVLLEYPFYDSKAKEQLFPFRTFAMGSSLFALVVVSLIARFILKLRQPTMSQDEIDIIRISYKEPDVERVTSFSKISRWSGSYNSITASASELRSRDDKSLLRSTLTKSNSNRQNAVAAFEM